MLQFRLAFLEKEKFLFKSWFLSSHVKEKFDKISQIERVWFVFRATVEQPQKDFWMTLNPLNRGDSPIE